MSSTPVPPPPTVPAAAASAPKAVPAYNKKGKKPRDQWKWKHLHMAPDGVRKAVEQYGIERMINPERWTGIALTAKVICWDCFQKNKPSRLVNKQKHKEKRMLTQHFKTIHKVVLKCGDIDLIVINQNTKPHKVTIK